MKELEKYIILKMKKINSYIYFILNFFSKYIYLYNLNLIMILSNILLFKN